MKFAILAALFAAANCFSMQSRFRANMEMPIKKYCHADPFIAYTSVNESRMYEDVKILASEYRSSAQERERVRNYLVAELKPLGYHFTLLSGVSDSVHLFATLSPNLTFAATDQVRTYLSAEYYSDVGGLYNERSISLFESATGTATLLEIARAFAASVVNPNQTYDNFPVFAFLDKNPSSLGNIFSGALEKLIIVHLADVGFVSDKPYSQKVSSVMETFFPDVVAAVAKNDYLGDFFAVLGPQRALEEMAFLRFFSDEYGVGDGPNMVFWRSEGSPGVLNMAYLNSWFSCNIFAQFLWGVNANALVITDTGRYRNRDLGSSRDNLDSFGAVNVRHLGRLASVVASFASLLA